MKRQTKLMLALLAILALAATSCAKLQARDNLNKGVRAFRDAHYENAVKYFQRPSSSIRTSQPPKSISELLMPSNTCRAVAVKTTRRTRGWRFKLSRMC